MKNWIIVLVVLVGTSSSAMAITQFLGWTDEFLAGEVTCNTTNSRCTVRHNWGGYWWLQDIGDPTNHPTWSHIGQQGGNATGRANAKAKVMFRFRDVSSSGYTVTVTLSRFRLTSIPGEGSACTGGSFVGSVSQTIDSLGIPATDWLANNRLLPVYNFWQETAVWQTIGYHEDVTASGTMGNSFTAPGCYKIAWLN